MSDADDYENLSVESLQQARHRGPLNPGWQGALVQAVSGLGWAVLAHMKREEERYTVVAIDPDPLKDLIGEFDSDKDKP